MKPSSFLDFVFHPLLSTLVGIYSLDSGTIFKIDVETENCKDLQNFVSSTCTTIHTSDNQLKASRSDRIAHMFLR